MMKSMLTPLAIASVLAFALFSGAESPPPAVLNVDPGAVKYLNLPNLYPKAKEGETRHHFIPPVRPDEGNCKIEISASKTMVADSANRQLIPGQFEDINIEGWGFNYYKLTVREGATISTLIGGGHPVQKSVQAGENLLIRYNSKLPVVVIAPAGYEIKYRVWTAPGNFEPMQKD